jgi:hypothetical protein
MKSITKAPLGKQVVLALWPTRTDPMDRVGHGVQYNLNGESSGNVNLWFRLYDNADKTIHAHYDCRKFDEAVSSIMLRIFVSHKYGSSAGFLGHEIHYAESATLMSIAKTIAAWEERAQALHLGGKEPLETCLRRMFVGAGVKRAVLITPGSEYPTIGIEEAIRDYVEPAIASVAARIERCEAA